VKICNFCKGQGHIKQQKDGILRTIICPSCKGKTKNNPEIAINWNRCIYCGGTGFIVGCCGENTIECAACK